MINILLTRYNFNEIYGLFFRIIFYILRLENIIKKITVPAIKLTTAIIGRLIVTLIIHHIPIKTYKQKTVI